MRIRSFAAKPMQSLKGATPRLAFVPTVRFLSHPATVKVDMGKLEDTAKQTFLEKRMMPRFERVSYCLAALGFGYKTAVDGLSFGPAIFELAVALIVVRYVFFMGIARLLLRFQFPNALKLRDLEVLPYMTNRLIECGQVMRTEVILQREYEYAKGMTEDQFSFSRVAGVMAQRYGIPTHTGDEETWMSQVRQKISRAKYEIKAIREEMLQMVAREIENPLDTQLPTVFITAQRKYDAVLRQLRGQKS